MCLGSFDELPATPSSGARHRAGAASEARGGRQAAVLWKGRDASAVVRYFESALHVPVAVASFGPTAMDKMLLHDPTKATR